MTQSTLRMHATPRDANATPTNTPPPSGKEKPGAFEGMKQAATSYAQRHSHAMLYGAIGFIAATLVLTIGLWPTILLALFAAAGVIVGRYRDGDQKTQKALRNLLERMK